MICRRLRFVAMPLWGKKRKGFPRKEEIVDDGEDGEEEGQEKGANAARAVNGIGVAGARAQAKEGAIFAAGRFHDLGLAPALSNHIHG